ncbi:hypothetical protein HDU67_001079, partial [Dinochytrium kinnereticum]
SVRFHPLRKGFDARKYWEALDGIDLVDDPAIIRELVPGCTPDVQVMMHVRKAGYLDVFQLGKLILEKAMLKGVEIVRGRVEDVEWSHSDNKKMVRAVRVRDPETNRLFTIQTNALVIASGPYLREIGEKCGVDFPVINELHARVAIRDPLEVVPSDAAFTIWSDDIILPFSEAERTEIARAHERDPDFGYGMLLDTIEVPGIAGAHARPLVATEDGGVRQFYGIWTYDNDDVSTSVVPDFPPPIPPLYGVVILRGLSRMFPGLKAYFGDTFMGMGGGSSMSVEAGYYCKTEDNTPLLGVVSHTTMRREVEGLFCCAGVSGFGVMCSQSAGEGVAAQVLGHLGVGMRGSGAVGDAVIRSFSPMRFAGKGGLGVVGNKLRTANQL